MYIVYAKPFVYHVDIMLNTSSILAIKVKSCWHYWVKPTAIASIFLSHVSGTKMPMLSHNLHPMSYAQQYYQLKVHVVNYMCLNQFDPWSLLFDSHFSNKLIIMYI